MFILFSQYGEQHNYTECHQVSRLRGNLMISGFKSAHDRNTTQTATLHWTTLLLSFRYAEHRR